MEQTKEILRKVKKLELKTKHLVDGLLQGAYHSVFRGRGIEFSEVREYMPGDDTRTIDWNVTARMNHPFVKEFIEERDLTLHILLDVSASNEFGSKKSKKEMCVELAASLMFAAIRNNDKVGLCMFTDKVEKYIPARKGKKHVLRLVSEMVQFKASGKGTDLSESMKFLAKVSKRKSIVFIISDFFSENEFMKALKLLRNRHDVIAVNINDIRESEIPDVGYIELEDEETGEQILVDTSDSDFREKYHSLMDSHNNSFIGMLRKLKVDLVQLRSDEPFEIPLRRFFRMRERRMVR